MMELRRLTSGLVLLVVVLAGPSRAGAAEQGLPEGLATSLTFAATFDQGFDADVAQGDPTFFSAATAARETPVAGPDGPGIDRIAEGGRSGGALRFTQENRRVHFFRVEDNLPFEGPDGDGWSGSISYFLNLDPESELPPAYVDPIQITQKAWNDAAIWNDFTKDDRPRVFRLGVLADLKVWNPENADFDALPPSEKPVVPVTDTPFAKGRWTHIVITFDHFNTGRTDGEARLYLDGELQGAVSGWNQRFSWDPSQAVIFLGLGYAGLMDDLMIFDRSLSADEVRQLTEAAASGSPLLTP
ncbi:LamG domain-containing protein [Tautonia rosea]|uniref:LamG domain-containing protein n=1 Tax=Tautonia rosea TaxID=2728037 RepID=UPI00147438B6|nr:LamG domain-containing protein [Tautonia rosea]